MEKINSVSMLTLLGVSMVASVAYAGPARRQVRHRQERQAARINQGVRSGELTKSEAHELRKNEQEIRQEKREMIANDGKIDSTERKELNKDLNEQSKEIYEQKHDEETRK